MLSKTNRIQFKYRTDATCLAYYIDRFAPGSFNIKQNNINMSVIALSVAQEESQEFYAR